MAASVTVAGASAASSRGAAQTPCMQYRKEVSNHILLWSAGHLPVTSALLPSAAVQCATECDMRCATRCLQAEQRAFPRAGPEVAAGGAH